MLPSLLNRLWISRGRERRLRRKDPARLRQVFKIVFWKFGKFCFGPLPDQFGSFGTKPSAIDVKNPKESENRAQNPPNPPKTAKKRKKNEKIQKIKKNLKTCLWRAQFATPVCSRRRRPSPVSRAHALPAPKPTPRPPQRQRAALFLSSPRCWMGRGWGELERRLAAATFQGSMCLPEGLPGWCSA